MVVFTTLAEKDYFFGAISLINSIIKNGRYGNKVIIGYRGELPKWLPKLRKSKNGLYFILDNDFEIELVELKGELHMVHEKPKWFKNLVENLEPNATEYFFFDSDITIINRMSFFGEWVKQGVALCEDVNYEMAFNHPIRKQWISLVLKNNKKVNNPTIKYYNSGFIGWKRSDLQFIYEWDECFGILAKISSDLTKFRVSDRTDVALSANQDSLNMAAMTTLNELSTIGPEAMGFRYGLHLMLHPLGPKPWKRKYIKDFINGNPPRNSDISFWQNINSNELKPYSNVHVKYKYVLLRVLMLFSRFYSKAS